MGVKYFCLINDFSFPIKLVVWRVVTSYFVSVLGRSTQYLCYTHVLVLVVNVLIFTSRPTPEHFLNIMLRKLIDLLTKCPDIEHIDTVRTGERMSYMSC